MQRPSSRASEISMDSTVSKAGMGFTRPTNAARSGTASTRVLGTATRNARPGTGSQGFMNTNLFVPQVTDRPVTQQGMAGPKTASGPRRQITDKNFYLAQLRQKRSELIEITNQLQVSSEALQLRCTQSAKYRQHANLEPKHSSTLQSP